MPLEVLARKLDVSKALIYAYFPTQYDLVNGLLHKYMPGLIRSLLVEIQKNEQVYPVAKNSALIYFDHVAEFGPLLHILMSDFYAVGHIDRDMLELQGRVFGKLARIVQRSFSLDATQSLATVRLFAALVEEAGTLSFRGAHDRKMCWDICVQLIEGGLDGMQTLQKPMTNQNDARRGAVT